MDVRLVCSRVPLWSAKHSHSYVLRDKIVGRDFEQGREATLAP